MRTDDRLGYLSIYNINNDTAESEHKTKQKHFKKKLC